MRFVAFLSLLVTALGTAGAQGRVYPEHRNFLVVGDGIGTAVGGVLTGTTIVQTLRLSGVATISGSHAIDVTALRVQTVVPPGGRVNDLEYANPEGDALIVSYAQLHSTRARGIPSELALGGGIVRRNTADPGRTRDTWIGRAGLDIDPFARWSHLDTTVGFNLLVMPAKGSDLVYIATAGLFFRIG